MSELNTEHQVKFTRLAWWMILARAVISIGLGLYLLDSPVETVATFIWVYGLFVVVDGIIAIAYGMGIFGRPSHRGMPIARGLLAVVAGTIALTWPGITALAVFYLVAIWAIAAGVVEMVEAFSLRDDKHTRWYFDLTSGLVYLLLGALMIASPGTSVIAIVWLIAVMMITAGIAMLMVAISSRKEFTYKHQVNLPPASNG